MLIAGENERANLLAVNQALEQQLGVTIHQLSGLELLELDPNANLADNEFAALDSDAGLVEPVQVVVSYAEAARARGVEVCLGVEVKRALIARGKVTGVETNEGIYECGTLVLAAGPWSAALAREAGCALPVQASRTQLALFRRPPDCSRRGVVCADLAQGLLFKPAPGDLIEASLLSLDEMEKDVDPETANQGVDGSWLQQVRQRLSRRYPVMHRSYGRGGYGALCAVTPDGLPILDRLPGVEGVYCAAGFSGQDVQLAPLTGQLLADLILSGEAGSDLAPFRLARFEAPA